MKTRVLILCTGNSCRSQMAEGILRHCGGDKFEAFSAGTKPSNVNETAIKVMNEIGIDISKQRSKNVSEYLGQPFDYVITVCDNAKESCPILPGKHVLLHWPFPDPPHDKNISEDVLNEFRKVRDLIYDKFSRVVLILVMAVMAAGSAVAGDYLEQLQSGKELVERTLKGEREAATDAMEALNAAIVQLEMQKPLSDEKSRHLADAYALRGTVRIKDLAFEAASNDFLKAISIEPSAQNYGKLAHAQFYAGKINEASVSVSTAIRKDPENASFYVTRAAIRAKRKAVEAAQQDIETARAKSGGDPLIYHETGLIARAIAE